MSVSVFPLVNKEELVETAHRISDDLRAKGIISEYDASGTIGRRYARSDEIGVPFAVTVDHVTGSKCSHVPFKILQEIPLQIFRSIIDTMNFLGKVFLKGIPKRKKIKERFELCLF